MSDNQKFVYEHNTGERTIMLRVYNRTTGKMIRSSQYQFATPAEAKERFDDMQRGGDAIGA